MCAALLSALSVCSWGGAELCHELRVYRKDQELASLLMDPRCTWGGGDRTCLWHTQPFVTLWLPLHPHNAPMSVLLPGSQSCWWLEVTVPAGTGFATQPFPIQVPGRSNLPVPAATPVPQHRACTCQGNSNTTSPPCCAAL